MLEAIAASNTPLSELVADYNEFPQTLLNIQVVRKDDFNKFPEIISTISEVKSKLKDSGRLNLRYSGTESLARIMIEGENQDEIENYAQQIAKVIRKYLS